mmetsp:Transcript_49971/g.130147  ORF Transcript_49971/g.130147 Transcript_49971/m.130147 type:complete len:312 (-) Transcript_49971:283-1218(-)
MRLLRAHVGGIVGEEDEAAISIDGDGPFRAGEIEAPAALSPLIVRLRARMDSISAAVPQDAALQQLTAFLDPIDGTKEFCSGLGEQCSICIGFADSSTGAAVGGLVYRPLCPQRSWALGCKREGVVRGALRSANTEVGGADAGKGLFLCSNGGTSPFLKAVQAALGYAAYPAGGAGNKALLALELPSAVYIQDRGVSRWDTCAAQAVLEAHGGCLARLDAAISGPEEDAPLESYTYVNDASCNSVLVPSLATLTRYNARAGVEVGGAALSAKDVKPYANLCGLFALPPTADVTATRAIVRRAAQDVPPAYD